MNTQSHWAHQHSQLRAAPGARGLAFAASVATVLGAALPFLSPGGPDSQLFTQGSNVAVTYVLLAGLLLVGVFATSRTSAAVAVAGGAGLFTFGLNTFIATIGWVTIDGANDCGDYCDYLSFSIGAGAGLICTSAAAALGLLAFLAALGAQPPAGRVPRTSPGLAWVGVLSGIATGVGLTLPPPDVGVGWSDWAFASGFSYAGQLNFGAACFYAGSMFAIVAGFALATRWGLGMVIGGLLPLLWMMLSWIGDVTGSDSSDLDQVFKTELHPLFGVGCALSVVCLAVGYATSTVGATATPARWATDPFGRYEHRYWDGWQWTAQVATGGTTAHDLPVERAAAASQAAWSSPPPSTWAAPSAAPPDIAPHVTGDGADGAGAWWLQDAPTDDRTMRRTDDR